MNITHKSYMYSLLTKGLLGNTIPQFSSIEDWITSPLGASSCEWWGVRTKTPGGPCLLNVNRDSVGRVVDLFSPHPINISVMISSVGNVTLMGQVWDSPTGLYFEGVEYPPKVHDWRTEMIIPPNRYSGIACINLLKRHLNPNSYEDLMELVDKYPGHIYEFSTLDVCYGILSHRNAIMWEVRCY